MPGALSLTIFILNTSQSGISRVKFKQTIFRSQYISVIRGGISDLISHAGIQSDLDLLLQDPLINIPLSRARGGQQRHFHPIRGQLWCHLDQSEASMGRHNEPEWATSCPIVCAIHHIGTFLQIWIKAVHQS